MEEFLVATILERLFKTLFRVFYKEHTVLCQSSHDYHIRTVQSIQDDGNNIYWRFLEYDPVREMNLIYVAKRWILILQDSSPVWQFLSVYPDLHVHR